jgi:AcrR family transcriptional regulator
MESPLVRRTQEQREQLVLDAADELFYSRGVHEVGMDELIAATGLGKASVYRLYNSKEELIAAYLQRKSDRIFEQIPTEVADAEAARLGLLSILDSVEADIARVDFRGCAFNNASVEFRDPGHPARTIARRYRESLRDRLLGLAGRLRPNGDNLGLQLAVLIDGAYVNASHLGPHGPASAGLSLARDLVGEARP